MFSFKAEVFIENKPMLRLLDKLSFKIERTPCAGVYELELKLDIDPDLKG